jgi:hypothetical protein
MAFVVDWFYDVLSFFGESAARCSDLLPFGGCGSKPGHCASRVQGHDGHGRTISPSPAAHRRVFCVPRGVGVRRWARGGLGRRQFLDEDGCTLPCGRDPLNKASPIAGLYYKDAKVLFLGLDGAGKTTLLQFLKTGKITSFEPTKHAGKEELVYGSLKIEAHDLGGHVGGECGRTEGELVADDELPQFARVGRTFSLTLTASSS